MVSIIQKIENIVKKEMSVMDGTAHSFQHVHRVFNIATFLAEKEKADLELVQIGALMHNLGRAVGKPHSVTGAKLVNQILLDLQYLDEKRRRIVRIVKFHPLSKKDDLKFLEEMVLWDADKIDLIGADQNTSIHNYRSNKKMVMNIKT